MELRAYWDIIRRRWWLPAALTLLALLAATAVALRGAGAYKTEMRLWVSTSPAVDPTHAYYDPQYYDNLASEYLADDLTEFLTSEAFAGEVSRELNSEITLATVASATRAKKTHRFIDVAVSSSTPEEGQKIAGSIARIISDPAHLAVYLKAANAQRSSVNVVTPPYTHRSTTPVGLVSEIGLRTLAGLVLGILLAFLLDYLDPSVRDRREAEEMLRLPVLAEVPRLPRRRVRAA